MFLAGKAAYAGIVFLLLTTWISGPRPTPDASRATLSKDLSREVPGHAHPNDVSEMQQTLRGKGHYRGKVDGVFGLRTRAGIRAYQKAENLPVTGQFDTQTAGKLGLQPEDREKTGSAAAHDKPSAGIEWARGSRRASKALRIPIKRRTASDGGRGDSGKTLQAENDEHPQ
jgi:hypothetical protein